MEFPILMFPYLLVSAVLTPISEQSLMFLIEGSPTTTIKPAPSESTDINPNALLALVRRSATEKNINQYCACYIVIENTEKSLET